MSANHTSLPIRNPRAIIRAVGGEHLVFCEETGEVHRLNEAASFVLGLCDGLHTRTAIIDRLVERYDIDYGQARSDVNALLVRFEALGILSYSASQQSNSG